MRVTFADVFFKVKPEVTLDRQLVSGCSWGPVRGISTLSRQPRWQLLCYSKVPAIRRSMKGAEAPVRPSASAETESARKPAW